FFSKDPISDAPRAAGRSNPIAEFAFVVGIFAAGLTSFYSWRLIFMTFHGTAKWAHADAHGHDAHAAHGADDHAGHAQAESHSEPLEDDHGHGHDDHGHAHTPHESNWVTLFPLLVLAV